MIINLTLDEATPEQLAAGVVDVADRERLSRLLTVPVGGPDGFAAQNPGARQARLERAAENIIDAFVVPALADATREHYNAMYEAGARAATAEQTGLEDYDPAADPRNWDDVQAMNARCCPSVVQAMVAGFVPLMSALVPMLREIGCEPLVALSDRVTTEQAQPDGSVRKVSTFVHVGFHPA